MLCFSPEHPVTHLVAFIDSIHPAFHHGDAAAGAKATEAGHVKLLQDMYGMAARGEFAAFAGVFAEDVRLDISGPPEVPIAGRWEGRDRVLAAVGHNFSLLEDQRPVVESVVAQGDTVVVLFEETGRVKATGQE